MYSPEQLCRDSGPTSILVERVDNLLSFLKDGPGYSADEHTHEQEVIRSYTEITRPKGLPLITRISINKTVIVGPDPLKEEFYVGYTHSDRKGRTVSDDIFRIHRYIDGFDHIMLRDTTEAEFYGYLPEDVWREATAYDVGILFSELVRIDEMARATKASQPSDA